MPFRAEEPCGAVAGPGLLCGSGPARPYLVGWRCPDHTPSRGAGVEEPGPGSCAPKRCYCGEHPWWTDRNAYLATVDSWVTDARAIASGKRRASPRQRVAAKQTVAEQQARRRG